MVSVSCFGVRFSVCSTLCLFIILLVQFWLLSGHLLKIAARSVSNMFSGILSICNIYLFPVLVLRTGFTF